MALINFHVYGASCDVCGCYFNSKTIVSEVRKDTCVYETEKGLLEALTDKGWTYGGESNFLQRRMVFCPACTINKEGFLKELLSQ